MFWLRRRLSASQSDSTAQHYSRAENSLTFSADLLSIIPLAHVLLGQHNMQSKRLLQLQRGSPSRLPVRITIDPKTIHISSEDGLTDPIYEQDITKVVNVYHEKRSFTASFLVFSMKDNTIDDAMDSMYTFILLCIKKISAVSSHLNRLSSMLQLPRLQVTLERNQTPSLFNFSRRLSRQSDLGPRRRRRPQSRGAYSAPYLGLCDTTQGNELILASTNGTSSFSLSSPSNDRPDSVNDDDFDMINSSAEEGSVEKLSTNSRDDPERCYRSSSQHQYADEEIGVSQENHEANTLRIDATSGCGESFHRERKEIYNTQSSQQKNRLHSTLEIEDNDNSSEDSVSTISEMATEDELSNSSRAVSLSDFVLLDFEEDICWICANCHKKNSGLYSDQCKYCFTLRVMHAVQHSTPSSSEHFGNDKKCINGDIYAVIDPSKRTNSSTKEQKLQEEGTLNRDNGMNPASHSNVLDTFIENPPLPPRRSICKLHEDTNVPTITLQGSWGETKTDNVEEEPDIFPQLEPNTNSLYDEHIGIVNDHQEETHPVKDCTTSRNPFGSTNPFASFIISDQPRERCSTISTTTLAKQHNAKGCASPAFRHMTLVPSMRQTNPFFKDLDSFDSTPFQIIQSPTPRIRSLSTVNQPHGGEKSSKSQRDISSRRSVAAEFCSGNPFSKLISPRQMSSINVQGTSQSYKSED